MNMGTITKIKVEPGETLVLRTPGPCSLDNIEFIRKEVEAVFPGHKLFVLTQGAELLRFRDELVDRVAELERWVEHQKTCAMEQSEHG